MKMTLDNILEEIKKANSIVLLTHEHPDGDAIGSSLAMLLALKEMGKQADLIIPEHPKTFSFLPNTNEILKEGRMESYDLAIALDCATIQRLNGFGKYFENAKVKIQIDHHSKNTMFGDWNFVNPVSPACAQIVVTMLEYFGIEITKEIGTCLLTGIITDTGGFRYSSVTADTFEFAACLLEKGINVSDIYRRVLEVKTKTSFELHKLAMNRIEFLEEGKIAFTYILQEDKKKIGTETGDSEGIVEIGREVEGVEVSIYMSETEEQDGFKFSLRSNDYVNVSDVCMMFGGGGHTKAAGCRILGDFEQVKDKMLHKVKEFLK